MVFSYPFALLGGLMIGLSASLLMLVYGKICGISGIFSGLFNQPKTTWRWVFIMGFAVGAILTKVFLPNLVQASEFNLDTSHMILAGLLVGIGTRIGGGCTSGHGVCGISRLSKRSIVATVLFMASAMVVVAIRGGL